MLRIVIGRAGTGKTYLCLTEIAEELKKDPAGTPLFLLVPAESTFAMEQALLERAGLPGVCRAQVLSFSRLLWRILQSAGGVPEPPLSDQGRRLLLAGLLYTHRDELTVFRDSADHWGLVDRLSRTIQELEQAGCGRHFSQWDYGAALNGAALKACRNAAGGEVILQAKARDLAFIWKAYRERLAELGLTDEIHCWQRAIQGVDKARYLDGAEFWIDGIDGFTPREKQLIRELLKKTRRMTVTLRLDPGVIWQRDNELFAYSLGTLEDLIGLARDAGIPYLVQALTGGGKLVSVEVDSTSKRPVFEQKFIGREIHQPRFAGREELAHLEEQLCCPKGTRAPFEYIPQRIKIVYPANRRDEVEQVARYLIGQAREAAIRWRDMAVAVSDWSLYEGLVTDIFNDCGIPFFLDQSRSVHWHPLVVFLSGVMELITRGWRTETVIQILKSDMVSSSRSAVDRLENYLLANGIDGELWQNPVVRERMRLALVDEVDISQLLGPLLELYERLHAEAEAPLSGTELMTALWHLVEQYGIPERIDYWANLEGEQGEGKIGDDLAWGWNAARHVDVWNLWVELVDDYMQTLGRQLMTPSEFAAVLQAGLDNLRLTSIPQGLDQVLVTSPLRILNSEVRVLAVLGADEQHLQLAGGEDTILNDAERRALQTAGWSLETQGELQRQREPVLWYSLFTRAKDSLYISSPLADGDGKALEPAEVVKDIQALFPYHSFPEAEVCLPCTTADAARFVARTLRAIKDGLQQETEQCQTRFLLALYQWLVQQEQGRAALRRSLAGFSYTTQAGPLSSQVVQQLYGDTLTTNVYHLEAAAQCLYQYFARAVLRLDERERLQWDARVEGQLWHEAVAILTRYLLETGQDLAELEEESLTRIAEEVWQEAAGRLTPLYATAVESYYHRMERLGRGFQRIVRVLAEHSRRGQFRPAAVEVAFGLSRGIPPLQVDLEPEGTLRLRGRIDRIETARAGDTLYVRIIDFKRRARRLKLSDVYYGFSLQLLVYLAALLDNAEAILPHELSGGGLEVVPAGVLYLPLSEPMVKADGPEDEETLAKKLLVEYRTGGLLLADTDVLKLMEAEISGRSELLPVGIKQNGEIYKGSSTYSLEELKLLVAYVKGLIKALAEGIRAGQIAIEPYRKTGGRERACQYCPYTAVCRFELGVSGCRYRYIAEIADDEVLKRMKQAAAVRASGTDEVERGSRG